MVLQLELVEGSWNINVLQRNTKEVIAVTSNRVVVNCERLDLQALIGANCIILTKKYIFGQKKSTLFTHYLTAQQIRTFT